MVMLFILLLFRLNSLLLYDKLFKTSLEEVPYPAMLAHAAYTCCKREEFFEHLRQRVPSIGIISIKL